LFRDSWNLSAASCGAFVPRLPELFVASLPRESGAAFVPRLPELFVASLPQESGGAFVSRFPELFVASLLRESGGALFPRLPAGTVSCQLPAAGIVSTKQSSGRNLFLLVCNGKQVPEATWKQLAETTFSY
jgi:hypothetical protein